MDTLTVVVLVNVAIFGGNYVWRAMKDAQNGVDRRSAEQRLMDTTISDRVTRFGSAIDAMNAHSRGQKPKTRF